MKTVGPNVQQQKIGVGSAYMALRHSQDNKGNARASIDNGREAQIGPKVSDTLFDTFWTGKRRANIELAPRERKACLSGVIATRKVQDRAKPCWAHAGGVEN